MKIDLSTPITNSTSAGVVFWITGLPRSGKTTLGRALWSEVRSRGYSAVSLDGDEYRQACGSDLGFDMEDRLVNARRLSGLCGLLARQGHVVVCQTVSLFSEIHALNRRSFDRYVEVLLQVPASVRRQRDPSLYDAANEGEAMIPGVNQPYELPTQPHLRFESGIEDLCVSYAVEVLLRWLPEGEAP